MGKVVTDVLVENLSDLFQVEKGQLAVADRRRLEIPEALVDTGATMFGMPGSLIRQLGLTPTRKRQARTTAGVISVQVYGAVRITIQGRDTPTDVTELPEKCPVLVGPLALEALDLVVDPIAQQVTGNPAHDGEYIIEMY